MFIYSWNFNLDVCRVFYICKVIDIVLILYFIVGVGGFLNYVED